MSEAEVVREIIETCRRLHAKNMLAAADGNVSYRLSDDRILITPSMKHKAYFSPEDMAAITLDNRVIQGNPSSERLMHLEIYRSCPLARCVVHAHPPTAIAWSIAHPELKALPAESMPEVILAAGEIPFVPYARPSSAEMGRNLRVFLPDHRVMILSRHGAVAWGESLMEAYMGMERVEHAAQILQLARSLGGLTPLPEDELKHLREMRKNFGGKCL